MTGKPDWNRTAFIYAEMELSQQGHTVLSPADTIPLVLPEQISHEQYLHICFAMIDVCDTVYFLKGWEQSKGSRAEMDYALEHDKERMFEP